jgi:hypothetical protein
VKKLFKIWIVFFLIFLLGVIGVVAAINKTLNKKTLIEFNNPTYSEVLDDTSFPG